MSPERPSTKNPIKKPVKKSRLKQGDSGSDSSVQLDGIELTQFDKEQCNGGGSIPNASRPISSQKAVPTYDWWKETLLLHRPKKGVKLRLLL